MNLKTLLEYSLRQNHNSLIKTFFVYLIIDEHTVSPDLPRFITMFITDHRHFVKSSMRLNLYNLQMTNSVCIQSSKNLKTQNLSFQTKIKSSF
jgi:hypothetical protein